MPFRDTPDGPIGITRSGGDLTGIAVSPWPSGAPGGQDRLPAIARL
jgi:hypothetical protein